MSHPDPLFDPENSYEDDEMSGNYDDYEAFYGEDSSSYHPDADHEISSQFDEDENEDEGYADNYDDSMDGDHESGFTSCGWGTDESYGHFCDDEACGFYGDDYDYIGEDY